MRPYLSLLDKFDDPASQLVNIRLVVIALDIFKTTHLQKETYLYHRACLFQRLVIWAFF